MDPRQTTQGYFPLVAVFIMAGGLAFVMWVLATLLGPHKPSPVKESPFECGSEPVGSARDRFGVKFYVLALLFLVFDVEAVFIYPWAVQLKQLGWVGYASMAVFASTLVVGLVYVVKKGVLDWESDR